MAAETSVMKIEREGWGGGGEGGERERERERDLVKSKHPRLKL